MVSLRRKRRGTLLRGWNEISEGTKRQGKRRVHLNTLNLGGYYENNSGKRQLWHSGRGDENI